MGRLAYSSPRAAASPAGEPAPWAHRSSEARRRRPSRSGGDRDSAAASVPRRDRVGRAVGGRVRWAHRANREPGTRLDPSGLERAPTAEAGVGAGEGLGAALRALASSGFHRGGSSEHVGAIRRQARLPRSMSGVTVRDFLNGVLVSTGCFGGDPACGWARYPYRATLDRPRFPQSFGGGPERTDTRRAPLRSRPAAGNVSARVGRGISVERAAARLEPPRSPRIASRGTSWRMTARLPSRIVANIRPPYCLR